MRIQLCHLQRLYVCSLRRGGPLSTDEADSRERVPTAALSKGGHDLPPSEG